MEHHSAVQRAVHFIRVTMYQDIDLESLATCAGYSVSHFHAIFRAVTGQSPAEYIRTQRLYSACFDLAFTRERILDIAMKHRFSSQESFARAFAKQFGMPPGKYRIQTQGSTDWMASRTGSS